MKKLDLDWATITEFNFKEHHVLAGFQGDTISKISNSVVGLHSARLPTAYVSLISRLDGFITSYLRDDLYKNGNLIKLRCMRRTLHVVPLELAPTVHQATLHFRIADCHLFYKRNSLAPKKVNQIKNLITDFLSENPSNVEDVCKNLALQKIDKAHAKVVLKNIWEEGELCYINASENWGSEKRIYALTSEMYPGLDLNSLTVVEAQRNLVYRHISQFGPVTIKDISWWSGLSAKVIRDAIQFYSDEIIELDISPNANTFYILKNKFEALSVYSKIKEDWIALLAYEDSSLKGYYESRYRYVSLEYYDKLFNQIGEARASIILNGEVVGIWSWNKKLKQVDLELFKKLSKNQKHLLEIEKNKVEKCLNYGISIQQKLFN